MKMLKASSTQRGFSLLESLVSLLIVSFGLLVLAGVNLKLSHSEDVAKQRGEATRLAQEKIEDLRSFTQISAGAGIKAWDSLAGGADTVAGGGSYATNTSFTRTWQVLGATSDAMRSVQVAVTWSDRASEAQSLTFASVIAKSNPADSGSLGFPLPANTNLKNPKNRNLNIPVPAIDLGNGKSVVQLQVNFAVIFSNESGYVVQTCDHVIATAADLSTGCTATAAYILAGYVSGSVPTGLNVNAALITGSTGTNCSLADAVDQNTGTPIAGYKYYLCIISVPSAGAPWAGTLRLGGSGLNAGSDYRVCRFQYPASSGDTANRRNVQPYAAVAESLDTQNYIISAANSCPTVSSLATTQHQNCRSNNPNINANRTTDCPL